jgi:hypothetical protein
VTRCACCAASWTAFAALIDEAAEPPELDGDPPDGFDDAASCEAVHPAAASAAAVTAIAAQRVRLERESIATSAANSTIGGPVPQEASVKRPGDTVEQTTTELMPKEHQ